jgi:hypothetical protein
MSRVGLTLAAALLIAASPASAQGLFESLFGLIAPPPQAPARAPGPLTPGGRPYAMPSAPLVPRSTPLDDVDFDTGSRYRTLCVRTCDGYMFPISTRTTRRGFYRDQMRCRASCGEETRLFLVPAGAAEMAGAVDVHGRPYSSLRTANLYKKTRVDGCQCRPAPWSASEMNRHASYADAEESERAKRHADAILEVVRDAGGTIEIVEPEAAEADPGRHPPFEATADRMPDDPERQPAVPTPVAAPRPLTSPPRPSPAPRVVERRPKVDRIAAPPPAKPAAQPGPGWVTSPFALGATSTLTWPGDTPRRR